MRIAVNATCFNNRPSGARQRFLGIYSELIKRMPNDEFVIFEPADCRVASWFDGLPNITAVVTPVPSEGRLRKFLAGFLYWPSALRRGNFDIFEVSHLPFVRSPYGKTLLTVHDVRGMGQENNLFDRILFKLVLARSLKAADHVITVSESMKEEILSFFPDVSVSVIYNGVDASQFNEITEQDLINFKNKYNLPADYALTVGHFEKRKNYPCLIDGVSLLRERGISCPLLIIGNDSGERGVVEGYISSKNLLDNVKILSGLSDHEVRCAYKLCGFFIMSSSYEGFGIPILEAMAAQCPMVLSDLPVFREITQNKAIYFSHNNVEQMAKAVESVLLSKEEHSHLVEFGRKRIKDFRFTNLALQLEALYYAMAS